MLAVDMIEGSCTTLAKNRLVEFVIITRCLTPNPGGLISDDEASTFYTYCKAERVERSYIGGSDKCVTSQ